MPSITDLITPEAMRKLEQLVVRSRYVSEGAMSGAHKSPLKGQSVEFADRREYTKGDNLRHLDWKVFGRTERYYIRQFEEETCLRVHIIIDASGSMAYGSGELTKYQYACRLAAALGYIVSKQQDSLGLTIYDNEVREMVPARGGTRHLRLFIERLGAHEPKNVTDTGKALHALAEMISRRGLIVLLTDCFDDSEALFNAIAHFRKKMHDVILMQILDPVELELSINSIAEFIDLETDEKLEIDPIAARQAYKEELQKAIDATREKCAVLNVDYRLVSTGESFEDFVHQYLMERRRMSL
ncbi:MAG TPA: DUF58 domain-containing protein [Chthoniobacteraceae bacterium]|jgi:uncharacterized protein (DUF58 family)|nr:DUF58 domain-containing protein [Chthoniobacteraceae bacterium]